MKIEVDFDEGIIPAGYSIRAAMANSTRREWQVGMYSQTIDFSGKMFLEPIPTKDVTDEYDFDTTTHTQRTISMATRKVEIEIDEKLIPEGYRPCAVQTLGGSSGPNQVGAPAFLLFEKIWLPPAWLRLTKWRCVYRVGREWYAAVARNSGSFVLLGCEGESQFLVSSVLNCLDLSFAPPCGLDVPDEKTLFSW